MVVGADADERALARAPARARGKRRRVDAPKRMRSIGVTGQPALSPIDPGRGTGKGTGTFLRQLEVLTEQEIGVRVIVA